MKTSNMFLAAGIVAAIPIGLAAQESANPLVSGEKGFYGVVSHSVVATAEKMPEADYSFKPTPEVRSFGQLVGHVADAQYAMCSTALGEEAPVKGVETSKTSKADLVDALKAAVAYCGKAYGGMTDAQATAIVKMMGYQMSKLTVLSVNTGHTDEHYGNMVTYLRLKGIVPPSSENRGK